MKVLVLNGPNLNMLGIREPELYGNRTYNDLLNFIREAAKELDMSVEIFQSNSEGELVTAIQNAFGKFDGIVINAAAYTHTSVAILDALKAVGLPTAEVHLTDIRNREPFRLLSYVGMYAQKTVCGKGFEGYRECLNWLKETTD
ncbi:MAG: type II 3-dehydroquinate dehydratase [Clostridiales bacterium]|nr:type II 3-dehydroquinate dehydratase [Clostridiales bacterium]